MANETVGIGANLNLDTQAFTKNVGMARNSLGQFVSGASSGSASVVRSFSSIDGAVARTKAGMAQLKGGMSGAMGAARSGAMVLAPFTAGMGFAAKKAADFQQGMQNVQSILRASPKDFIALQQEAKRVGATTKFSATEATQGMELLGRAGFDAGEVLASTGALANLAAADSIDLATAADVASNTIRAMGLEAKDLGEVADVLAVTAAKSNTDVTALGESMKYIAPIAKTMGMNMKETALSVGLVANAGLKGSMGGTALKNMLLKLAKPSEKSMKTFNDLGISVQDSNGNLLPMVTLIENLSKGMGKVGGNMKQAAILSEAFGLRGFGSATALQSQLAKLTSTAEKDMVPVLDKAGNATGKMQTRFQELTGAINNSQGAAEAMANIRLDSVYGQFKILMSAVEGLSIEFFQPFLAIATTGLRSVGTLIQGVALSVAQLRNPTEQGAAGMAEIGSTAKLIGIGVNEAINLIQGTVSKVVALFDEGQAKLSGFMGPDALKNIAKFATIFAAVAAVAAPVLAGFVALGFTIGSVIVPAFTALWAIAAGVATVLTGPVGLAIVGLVMAFRGFSREGESVGQTFMRLWDRITTGAMDLWNNVLQPVASGFSEVWAAMSQEVLLVWKQVKTEVIGAWNEVVGFFSAGTGSMAVDWKAVGQFIGVAIATTAKVVIGIIGAIAKTVHSLFQTFGLVRDGIMSLIDGNVMGAIQKLGLAFTNFVLTPIRAILEALVRIADAVGKGSMVPQGVRDFLDAGLKPVGRQPIASGGGPTEVLTNAAADRDAAAAKVFPTVNVTAPEQERPKVLNDIRITMDGREVGYQIEQKQRETAERSGRSATPWQRKAGKMFGGAPTAK